MQMLSSPPGSCGINERGRERERGRQNGVREGRRAHDAIEKSRINVLVVGKRKQTVALTRENDTYRREREREKARDGVYDFDARNGTLHDALFSHGTSIFRPRFTSERTHCALAILAVLGVACSDDLLPDDTRPSTHENSRYGESR